MKICFYPCSYIDPTEQINKSLLEKEFIVELSDNPIGSDIMICTDDYPPIFPMEKTILLQKDSPLTLHRIWTYQNFDKFHTVITNSPMGPNQFKFTEHPEVYPWYPFPGKDKIRKSTKISERRVFYAGQRSEVFARVPDQFTNITTLYDVREKLVFDLCKYPNFIVFGINWPREVGAKTGISTKEMYTPTGYNWNYFFALHENKFEDINDSNADFILVLENTIQPNLIAEKIHDGFISDRVVLYFGEQNIDKHIPKDCYVDLRPLFDKKNKKIDADKLMEIVNNMTQKEYDAYIRNAREWRKTIFGRWEQERDKLTNFLIKRINSIPTESEIKIKKLKDKLRNLKN